MTSGVVGVIIMIQLRVSGVGSSGRGTALMECPTSGGHMVDSVVDIGNRGYVQAFAKNQASAVN